MRKAFSGKIKLVLGIFHNGKRETRLRKVTVIKLPVKIHQHRLTL